MPDASPHHNVQVTVPSMIDGTMPSMIDGKLHVLIFYVHMNRPKIEKSKEGKVEESLLRLCRRQRRRRANPPESEWQGC